MVGTSNRMVSEVPQLSCSAVGEHHVHWARLQDSWERDEKRGKNVVFLKEIRGNHGFYHQI